jgi:5-keto 4-deoxyuronate isomerase
MVREQRTDVAGVPFTRESQRREDQMKKQTQEQDEIELRLDAAEKRIYGGAAAAQAEADAQARVDAEDIDDNDIDARLERAERRLANVGSTPGGSR